MRKTEAEVADARGRLRALQGASSSSATSCPGQFVSQGELCELLDVPLGPTREALKRLEAESLVRLIPQRGIQIADIGVTLIHEAFEFRTVLELAACAASSTRADDATLARARARHAPRCCDACDGGDNEPIRGCSTPRCRSTGACTT